MGKLAKIIAKAGILPPEMLAQFQRWGHPVNVKAEPMTLEQLESQLEDALNEEDMVVVKVTDLESVQQYSRTQQKGVLHLVTEGGVEADIDVFYGRTLSGEYILPWNSESISELMCNGKTCLLVGADRVFFRDMTELFFGDTKAFMLCQAATMESSHATE